MNIFLEMVNSNNNYGFLFKIDLITITTLCIFNVYSNVGSYYELIFFFVFL